MLGADAKNIDALSPNAGDRRKSYATSQADQAGNRVYSDIYVAGKVVVLTQTIDAATTDLMPARTLAAQQVFTKAR